MIYKWDKKKYMHESNCMLIVIVLLILVYHFIEKKNHRVLPSCVCSSLAGAEIQKIVC